MLFINLKEGAMPRYIGTETLRAEIFQFMVRVKQIVLVSEKNGEILKLLKFSPSV